MAPFDTANWYVADFTLLTDAADVVNKTLSIVSMQVPAHCVHIVGHSKKSLYTTLKGSQLRQIAAQGAGAIFYKVKMRRLKKYD